MNALFSKWWFWGAAILAIVIFKQRGQAADIFGAAANARELSSTSYTAPAPAAGSVETISAIQKEIDNALAPYKSAVAAITAPSNVSANRTTELNQYADQMKAVTNAILAGNPKI